MLCVCVCMCEGMYYTRPGYVYTNRIGDRESRYRCSNGCVIGFASVFVPPVLCVCTVHISLHALKVCQKEA